MNDLFYAQNVKCCSEQKKIEMSDNIEVIGFVFKFCFENKE